MEIVLLIIGVICCIVSYFIGRNSVEKQEQINNEAILQERNRIELEIKYKEAECQRIENEYQSKLKIIQDAKTSAEEVYEIRSQQLADDFNKKKAALLVQHTQEKDALKIELESLNKELDSLKATRAAIIEAAQQEERLQADKDFYRLDISDQDARDILVLNTIKTQISKPRILSMLIWQTYYQPIAKQKFPLILGSKDVCGIYKITNLKDSRAYIGQAVDVRDRWNQHCKFSLGIDTPQGNKLYQAMIKEGLENFTFQLLEECPREELNQKEAYYINMYNSYEFGYNANTGIKGGK